VLVAQHRERAGLLHRHCRAKGVNRRLPAKRPGNL